MMSFAVLAIVKATLVCGVALSLSRLCRRTRASIRHLLLALAFAALVAIPSAGPVLPTVALTVPAAATAPARGTQEMTAVLSGAGANPSGSSALLSLESLETGRLKEDMTIAQVGIAMWLIGVALFLVPVVVGFWQMRRLRESASAWIEGQSRVDTLASALGVHRRVDAVLHDAVTGPMTCGVLRPAIVLPASAQEWDEASLRCALRHELEHVARWDFLTHCLSRMVCAVYWFHPLVWAAWRQMRLEAERACDDAVLREDEAGTYAALLVSMAQRQSADTRRPLLAMAGRADLATRVAAVLDRGLTRGRIGRRRAIGLIVTGTTAILGVASITIASAIPQTQPTGAATPSTTVASIRRNPPTRIGFGDGGMTATNVTVRDLLVLAYGVRDVANAPGWVNFDRFDIVAKGPFDMPAPRQQSRMLQSFLAERFKLAAHRGSREFPIYALVLTRPDGSLGPQMTRSQLDCSPGAGRARSASGNPPTATSDRPACGLSSSYGRIAGGGITMAQLARLLPVHVGSDVTRPVIDRQVVDRTGLSGRFDLTLRWTPDAAAPTPRLLAALQEQLGLTLDSQLAPEPVLIIDKIEPPTEN